MPLPCCHHRAIATNTAVESQSPPSSCRCRRQAAVVPVESPTEAMVYHLPGGIICLDSSDSSNGLDVEEIIKWDDCLQKTKTFSTAYLIRLSLIDSRTSSVLRRFLRHANSNSCPHQRYRIEQNLQNGELCALTSYLYLVDALPTSIIVYYFVNHCTNNINS